MKIRKKNGGGGGGGGLGSGGRVLGVRVEVNEELKFCEKSKKKNWGVRVGGGGQVGGVSGWM